MLAALVPLLLAACAGDPLEDAFSWDVAAVGVADTCNDPAVPSREDFTYSVVFDRSQATLYIGTDSFATGTLAGCNLEYSSPVVREDRGPGEEEWVQWELEGSATFKQGGSSCDVAGEAQRIVADLGRDWDSLELEWSPEELDWVGLETFTIVGVGEAVTDLDPGCTYTVLVAGVFAG